MVEAQASDTGSEHPAQWALPVTEVRFVDSRRAAALARLGLRTVGDLLYHLPRRYLDLSSTPDLASVRPGDEATVVGRVHEVALRRPRRGLDILEVAIVDGTGVLVGVWFNQPYLADRFKEGLRVAFAGKVRLRDGIKQIQNPLTEILDDPKRSKTLGRILPMHAGTEGLSPNWLRRLVREALDAYGDVRDFLPAEVRIRRGLPPLRHALEAIHFPGSMDEIEPARRRLAYEELFLLQILLASKRARERGAGAIRHIVDGPRLRASLSALGFSLTEDQERALKEILADMASEKTMDRLLLGDVGTGKTAVATCALAAAVDGGHQAAMMAPTEVLATQYATKVGAVLDAAGIAWALLTGSTSAQERTRIIRGLRDGSLSVLLGTHALFSDDVEFASLGLAVVDEQHRFGVRQRLALRSKGESVDLLVMSATPIPRSLALTAYGDLDISFLRQRPTGRDPSRNVYTTVIDPTRRSDAYDAIREAVARGRQAYVICPVVEGTADSDLRSATLEAQRLDSQVFPDMRVALLTGRMAPDEKKDVMRRFAQGDVDVLVATTVVEVGVDVPNATVMLVEDADRFGLAQLHQLRGRVGRGPEPGRLYLMSSGSSDTAIRRLEAVENTSDGFELAELDLRLRGEGDILGLRQSGIGRFRAASLIRDADLVEAAREDVAAIVEGGSALEADPVIAPALAMAAFRFPEILEGVTTSG